MSAQWLAIALLPGLLAWAAIAGLRRSPWAARLGDEPNERSLHAKVRPRVGGLGVMLGALAVSGWFTQGSLGVVLLAAAGLTFVSALDDLRSLPVSVRLGAHFAAGAVAVYALEAGLAIHGAAAWTWALAALSVLAIAWMTNLFNFMDGSDGLAGGMAVIGFSAYGAAALAGDAVSVAVVSFATASASLGFLLHNFAPARVFMGDAGSIPLGFLAGALGVAGFAAGAWPPWFPALVFSPFIVDATFTVVRRLRRREPVWRAHRSHYYQRLILAGWTHRRLALWAYVLMLAAAASALAGRAQGPMLQCGIISAWAAAYGLMLVAIERRLPPAGIDDRGSLERSVG
jgi:UDP-N-acetylmuramyl pentapeptide phosphotransferase/UDP-N-acetylglucosamine-1-phosphate transferase